MSAKVRDELIGAPVSAFDKAKIPDMSVIEPYWVAAFLLCNLGRAKFGDPMQAYAFNFLRRVESAFAEHQLARSASLSFVQSGGQILIRYVQALFHWETYLGQAWHAYALLMNAWKFRAFEKNDGSLEDRLNTIYNEMKHVETRIEKGQMPQGAMLPVWLDNQGLRSADKHLTFEETADVLKELAKYANVLVDPLTAMEKFSVSDA